MPQPTEGDDPTVRLGQALIRLIEAVDVILPHIANEDERTLLEVVQRRSQQHLKSLLSNQPPATLAAGPASDDNPLISDAPG